MKLVINVLSEREVLVQGWVKCSPKKCIGREKKLLCTAVGMASCQLWLEDFSVCGRYCNHVKNGKTVPNLSAIN